MIFYFSKQEFYILPFSSIPQCFFAAQQAGLFFSAFLASFFAFCSALFFSFSGSPNSIALLAVAFTFETLYVRTKINLENYDLSTIKYFLGVDNGYELYLVDEFKTSCMCSICKEEIGRCDKFQIRKIQNHIKVVIF